MKKNLALAALASAVASIGLLFHPVTMPYTPFAVGIFAVVGIALLITSR